LLPRWTRNKYRSARLRLEGIRKLAAKEREWRVPFRMRRPRWWLDGFLSRSAVLYQLDARGPDGYVSDLQRVYRTKRMVHPRLQEVINNKLTTHLLLGAMDIPSAKLLGVVWRGAVHRFPSDERVPLADYLRKLEPDRSVFFKLIAGAEGKSIFSVTRVNEDTWRIGGQEHLLDGAVDALTERRPMIVEEGLEQHAGLQALYPDAVNTIRVLTMLDTRNHQPFIVRAVQRIGTARSGSVDNWSRGGLSAQIDLDTGRLGPASRLPGDTRLEWFDTHPDTGAPITGTETPMWAQVRDLVLHSASVLSFLEYIGWDIVVTPDGPVVLEANINTGMNVLQVHGPLLDDPRVRAYYSERGVMPDLPQEQPADPV
jgi:hypothetical protein